MKAASIHELQKELTALEPKQLKELCIRLAKYKKDNKELLSYLLFEAHDEKTYVKNIKQEIDVLFEDMNRDTAYLTKKSLRKILRLINKFIKYSGDKQTEIELRIYFCTNVKLARIAIDTNTVLSNLYTREIEKIKTTFSKLHEDLQYDYKQELEKLGIDA
ncbi:MAG: hypothetical protein K8R85_07535 [Bacteroidetes bacterium]|nr:hypothetical protein [Bacteroidota bacterium]